MDNDDPELDRNGEPVAWDEVRRDYEGGQLTCNGIAHRYKLKRDQLDKRAKANKWLRPGSDEDIDRRLLIKKALGLLERQMDVLEMGMRNGNAAESKVLSDLIRDIDKLIAIERIEARQESPLKNRGEISELRRKLEARINAITKGQA